jgi:hypothetical protein
MKPETVQNFLENVNRTISLFCCNANEPGRLWWSVQSNYETNAR